MYSFVKKVDTYDFKFDFFFFFFLFSFFPCSSLFFFFLLNKLKEKEEEEEEEETIYWKFQAQINIDGKQQYLGTFDTRKKAARAAARACSSLL